MKKKVEFETIKEGIRVTIKRPKKDTYVMAIPLDDKTMPGLHVVYDGSAKYQNHYDFGSSREKIYLCSYNSTPSFFLKSGQNHLKISLDDKDDVLFQPLTETREINTYYMPGDYCISTASSCWGIFIYDTGNVDIEQLKKELPTKSTQLE